MENRTLEITVQNAKDLNKVNLISKMDVYAVVSISGGDKKSSRQKAIKTPVDHDGGCNPTWDFQMKFTVEEAALQQNRLIINFNLVCQRALGDKEAGQVHVSVKELLDTPAAKGGAAVGKKFVTYQVRKASGKPKGQLSFSYQFSDEISTSATPAAAKVYGECSVSSMYPVVGRSLEYSPAAGWYPPVANGEGDYYPPAGGCAPAGEYPPPHCYGYVPPPPLCYGYQRLPPPWGYGYQPQSGYYGYPPDAGAEK